MKKYHYYGKEIKSGIKDCLKKLKSLEFNLATLILFVIVVMPVYSIFNWREGNWDEVTASLSAIVALIAIFAVLKTNDTSRFCTGADLLIRLEERFTNKEMKAKRKKAAEAIQKSNYKNNNVSTILDFFSVIAILAHKKVLDKEMIWRTFSSWLIPYYASLEEHIKLERKEKRDQQLYKTLSNLYYELVTFETKESLAKLTDVAEIKKFYEDEIDECAS